MTDFDVVYLADLRFPGGTSTGLINELNAACRAGLNIAVLPVQSPILTLRRPPNDAVLAAIDSLGVAVVAPSDPIRTRLALVCHPSLFNQPSTMRIRIEAGTVAVVAWHPLIDAAGVVQYDLHQMREIIRYELGQSAILLPVGPKVRDGFVAMGEADCLWDRDWPAIIDVESWPKAQPRAADGRLVIGRHTRPDLLKWPDADIARLVYPDRSPFEYRMLGVDHALQAAFDPWPARWAALPFRRGAAETFLPALDVYSYYHSDAWIEAFGFNILEALATGIATVLPPHFEPVFGDAAIYAEPDQVAETYDRLLNDRSFRLQTGEAARRKVTARFGPDRYPVVIDQLAGPRKAVRKSRRGQSAFQGKNPRIMAITSNGVGVGHLARQLAIAGAHRDSAETVFFSLSKAVCFAAEAGYCTEYRAFHRQLGIAFEPWNRYLTTELVEAISFYRPDAVIFDGNIPYEGMLNAFDAFPALRRVWVRRAMWRNPEPVAIKRASHFHLTISPAEIAATADPGYDIAADPMVAPVATILPLDPADRYDRRTARQKLGLDPDREAVLVQLGSGSNYDMKLARDMTLERLLSDPDRDVVEVLSPARQEIVEPLSTRHHLVNLFPVFRYYRAFDYTVSAAGYNSFHEIVAGTLPCLFVANRASEMDLQETRADFAVRSGW
ncbi:MAG: hypothetical protein OEY05_02515, partial [Paracoccaceae bacterium]|nr:hypothetical protein [Paracoccaceae bacterium]